MTKTRISVAVIEVDTRGEEGVTYIRLKNLPPPPHAKEETWDHQAQNIAHTNAQSDKIKAVIEKALADNGFEIHNRQ